MTSVQIVFFILFPLAGYLLGSIPFAWVIGKAKGVDIRVTGSRNVGASNLGRTLGPKYFWPAFFLDAAKGFIPVLLASLILRFWNQRYGDDLPMWAPLLTGTACVVGHLFPIWLKFRGGKGVATGFGVVLGFWPLFTIAGIFAGMFFVFMLMIYRYISLASITAAIVFTALVAFLGAWENTWIHTWLPWHQRWPLIAVAALFTLLIVYRHRSNIGRLLKGTEPQIGQREIDKAKMQ